ncbi:hypothetical protein [uncultured Thermomonospora sp.]|uniref:hypothetical protein n=1 Tax=uncultured Thermomonospora sp. TaxID=671175 RepID=UPI00259AF96F|nr:hypothetical protein [uncultured Thermomonospora sp.]
MSAERAACPACGTQQRVNKTGTIRKHAAGPVPCTGSGQPVGPARIPRRSASGYYLCPVTGRYLKSVTTIIGQGSPKEAVTHWAGNIVAQTAMDNLPRLVQASMDPVKAKEAYDWLRHAHTRKKDERAAIGSAVHQLIEAKVLDKPVPEEILADPELAPYATNFEAFVRDWRVEFEASEMVVANYTEGYAGTLDYMLRSELIAEAIGAPADAVLLGDTKTGGALGERTYGGGIKGVYPEAGVQMAAYRRAEYGWLRDGTRVELPRAYEIGVVLHLRPEGYRLYPLRCGDEVFEAFLHIRQVAEFHSGLAKNVVGQALTPPTRTSQAQEVA